MYFPGAGMREGSLSAGSVHAEDELALVLRDFPFSEGGERELVLLPSQKSTKRVPFEAGARRVRLKGRETLELPAGRIDAYRLDLLEERGSGVAASYWFAADGSAPLLHALVQYEGPGGVSYRLRSHERTAYWLRD